MKAAISTFTLQRFLSPTLLAAAFMISFSFSLGAQQPVSNSVDAQREAMRKLSFLAGGHCSFNISHESDVPALPWEQGAGICGNSSLVKGEVPCRTTPLSRN